MTVYIQIYGFRVKTIFCVSLILLVLSGVHILRMLFGFIYAYWCPARFPYQMMFVSFNSNTMGVISGAGIAYSPRAPVFPLVMFVLIFSFCVVFCRSVFAIYPFFLRTKNVCCSSNSRLQITSLVSSNFHLYCSYFIFEVHAYL